MATNKKFLESHLEEDYGVPVQRKPNTINGMCDYQNDREETKEQLDADKKNSYVGIPPALLFCHVCSKHMGDSKSFKKHIRGRDHELRLTYLDEAYKAAIIHMRDEIKIIANKKEIDLERVTNNKNKLNSGNNKSPGTSNASKSLLRSYCEMCDVHFYGPLTGHTRSNSHKNLKKFLHPKCKLCDKIFRTSIDMDKHKLTSGHLKKVAVQRNVENLKLKNDEFGLADMIKVEEDDHDLDQIPVAKKYAMLSDRDAVKLQLEIEGSNEKYDKKKPAVTESNEVPLSTNATTDVKESVENISKTEDMGTSVIVATDQTEKEIVTNADLSVNENQAFTYNPDVALGKELLVHSKGFVCSLCSCFLMDEQRVSLHCQTYSHYKNYTTMTKKEQTTDLKTENLPEKSETDSAEQPAVKRITLVPSYDVEENDAMDITSEQSKETKVLNETESVKNTYEDEAPVFENSSDNEEKP